MPGSGHLHFDRSTTTRTTLAPRTDALSAWNGACEVDGEDKDSILEEPDPVE